MGRGGVTTGRLVIKAKRTDSSIAALNLAMADRGIDAVLTRNAVRRFVVLLEDRSGEYSVIGCRDLPGALRQIGRNIWSRTRALDIIDLEDIGQTHIWTVQGINQHSHNSRQRMLVEPLLRERAHALLKREADRTVLLCALAGIPEVMRFLAIERSASGRGLYAFPGLEAFYERALEERYVRALRRLEGVFDLLQMTTSGPGGPEELPVRVRFDVRVRSGHLVQDIRI